MGMKKKQTLKAAVKAAHAGQIPGVWALVGLPAGGWPETRQAMSRLHDELPRERRYTVGQLVDSLYYVDHADRYAAR